MADLKKQLKAIKKLLGDGRDLQLSDADALRYQDILYLLEERGYLHDFKVDGANLYRKMEDFDGFEDWLNEEIKSLAAEKFFHADYEATLREVYGPNSDADALVVEGGQL